MQEAMEGSAKEEEGGVKMTDDGTNKENNGEYSPMGTDDESDVAEQESIPVQKRRKLDRS